MSKKHKNTEAQDKKHLTAKEEYAIMSKEVVAEIEEYIESIKTTYAERIVTAFKDYAATEEFCFERINEFGQYETSSEQYNHKWHSNRQRNQAKEDRPLDADDVRSHIEHMLDAVESDPRVMSFMLSYDDDAWLDCIIADEYLEKYPECGEKYQYEEQYTDFVCEKFSESTICGDIAELVCSLIDEDELVALAETNPNYTDLFEEEKQEEEETLEAKRILDKQLTLTRQAVAEIIPSSLPDMFPAARRMKRHFVLHVGPTNSGKTYHAMRALQDAGSGAYLAPLRLLAYEQYERMNSAGYPCSLLTGEEMKGDKDAPFVSSTIEMLDIAAQYECVVIDEAQMIADEDRGGAWTTAIIGACAKTVHVCMAAHAKNIVIALINECHDTYEVVEHQRMTPLTYQADGNSRVRAKKGDAVIVFSRRSVHALAAELQAEGKKCSIIYGKLPYDVRHSEAEKFASGKTDVLVATDAIGMGMNLPIRRVVFYETEKYDGSVRREINAAEFQQIAGRAGRAGIYDEGFVSDLYGHGIRKHLRQMLNASIPDITHANVEFPRTLASIDAPLSLTLEVWQDIDLPNLYQKESVSEMVSRCRELEFFTEDKSFIYRFACINFAENDEELHELWLSLAKAELKRKPLRFKSLYIESIEDSLPDNEDSLDTLEKDSQKCDIFFNYCRSFNHTADMQAIEEARNKISGQIRRILDKQKLRGRRCNSCGKRMPWYHRYGLCDNCYEEMRAEREYYYDFGRF